MGRPKKNPQPLETSVASVKKIAALPEFFDVNTREDIYWETLLKSFAKITRIYGFSRVEAPLLEDWKLYQRLYGDRAEDLVVKLSETAAPLVVGLRPSQLPGILRYFVQQKLTDTPTIHKWQYAGWVIKKHLYDQMMPDYEFGCEILGDFNHLIEAQTIAAAWEFVSGLGLEGLILEVNNLGSLKARQNYEQALVDSLSPKKYDLCENCNEWLFSQPLKVLACENLDCKAVCLEYAPQILDFLDEESHKDFTCVLEALDEMEIPYQLNALYVGPEDLEKLNFAIKYQAKARTQNLMSGGHHDRLVWNLGGRGMAAQAFGFRGSLKLLRQIMQDLNLEPQRHVTSEVCLVPLGDLAARRSLRLFRDLTAEKILVYDHFGLNGVKNQLKIAQEYEVPIALIMGQKEAMDEVVILRDVKSGMQEIISYDKIVEEVKKRLGK